MTRGGDSTGRPFSSPGTPPDLPRDFPVGSPSMSFLERTPRVEQPSMMPRLVMDHVLHVDGGDGRGGVHFFHVFRSIDGGADTIGSRGKMDERAAFAVQFGCVALRKRDRAGSQMRVAPELAAAAFCSAAKALSNASC